MEMLKYRTLAAEITALGGLLRSPKRKELLEDPVILDLVAIMSHPQTDPILLTAICTFGLDLFECDEPRQSQADMEPFHKNLSDMKYLIPYLGFDNYLIVLEASQRYHLAENPGHKIIDDEDLSLSKPKNKDEDAEEFMIS